MNTVDPAKTRYDRIERRRGSMALLAGAVIASVAVLITGYLAGLGFGELIEQFRTAAMDSVFDDRGEETPYLLVVGTFAFFGCIIAGNLAAGAVRRYQGWPSRPAFPTALALLAQTVGTWVSSRAWLPPLAVGTEVDPVFHKDEAWGFWGWLMYYADWWAPALLLVIALLTVLYAIQDTRKYATMANELERLLIYGRRVPADVVDVQRRITSDESNSRTVHETITLSFMDLAGVRRWVTRRAGDTGTAIGTGVAEILFDPERPSAEKSIFVALRRRPAISDWLPGDWLPGA